MLQVTLFLIPWVLVGIAVAFVAFSGGPGAARQAYLTGGRRAFRIAIPLIYLGLGVAVPALVIADRDQATGATAKLSAEEPSAQLERGKELFNATCASCHNLDALNARGVTGPDLDEVGEMTPERVLLAIENGGTGQNQMPANLLDGESARAVAAYVAEVAGD